MTEKLGSTVSGRLADHYPFPEFRPGMKDVLTQIEKAVSDGKKIVLCHLPLGSGKSGVAVAFAGWHRSHVIAPTKLLQKQYDRTPQFSERVYTVFGKSNYNCGLPGFTNLTVEDAICCSDKVAEHNAEYTPWPKDERIWQSSKPARALKKRCAENGTCPYYSLIYAIEKKPGAVLNYDLFSHLKRTPDSGHGMELGSVVVMDEAHVLPDKVRSIFGYQLTQARAVRLLGQEVKRQTNEAPVVWLRRIARTAHALIEKETDQKVAANLTKFHTKIQKFLALDLEDPKKFHIDDQNDVLEIKPLDLRFLKETVFYPFECVLMMSATFPANFCELLGIEDHEKAEITIPSTFPAKNRPAVYVDSCPVLNWRTTFDMNHPSVVALQEILKKHADQKGIIHCANYRLFERLKELLYKDQRLLWVERENDKANLLEFHSQSVKPTVLVSPAMMEGVDLKDDLARFQVLFKVPYGSLDDYTRKMIEIFPNYYENETITKIVQAYGRAVRSVDDHAVFYILDGAFKRLVSTHKRLFPQYFLEALSVSRA